MTTDSGTNEPNEPIDADFEPAPAADYVVPNEKAGGNGPGWIPVGIIGALSLGAIGLSLTAPRGANSDAPTELADSIETLQASQKTLADQLSDLETSTSASEKKMASQVEALLSGDEDSEGLATLVAELESVSERLDEASLGGADSAIIQELSERIVALEEIGEDETASPRQVTRALASMRTRIDDLEEERAALKAQMAALTARIEDLEFALQDTGSAGLSEQGDLLADLQSEIENLQTAVERTEDIDIENEKRFADMLKNLQSAGEAEVQVSRAETTASAALAVSRIEAAAREGRSFHAAYKQLEKAMPDDAAVAALAPIARSGAPTLADLVTQFSGDRAAALEAVDLQAEDGWGWTRQVFGSGVKVRKSGQGGSARDLLDQAEDALKAGDIVPAIEAVGNLPDEARQVMEDWKNSAESRIALEAALDDIGVKLIGRDR